MAQQGNEIDMAEPEDQPVAEPNRGGFVHNRYSATHKSWLIQILVRDRNRLFTQQSTAAEKRRAWQDAQQLAVRCGIFTEVPQQDRVVQNWQYYRKLWSVWKHRSVDRRARLRERGREDYLSRSDRYICWLADFIAGNHDQNPQQNQQQRRVYFYYFTLASLMAVEVVLMTTLLARFIRLLR